MLRKANIIFQCDYEASFRELNVANLMSLAKAVLMLKTFKLVVFKTGYKNRVLWIPLKKY